MRKVVLYMTTTLDGFIAGPRDELDWMLSTPDRALNDDIVAADQSASAAGRDLAAAVNRLHRIIISNQPVDLPWGNSELVVARTDDDLVAAVTGFKRQPGSDLGVSGGVRTAQRFARLGLIDEYVLQVHPIALGAGKPLFTQKTELQLTSAKTYDSGVMRLRYKPRH